jgi:hypothetical protein
MSKQKNSTVQHASKPTARSDSVVRKVRIAVDAAITARTKRVNERCEAANAAYDDPPDKEFSKSILLQYFGVENVNPSSARQQSSGALMNSTGFKKLAITSEDAYESLKEAADDTELIFGGFIDKLLPVQFIHLQGTSHHDREALAEFRRQRWSRAEVSCVGHVKPPNRQRCTITTKPVFGCHMMAAGLVDDGTSLHLVSGCPATNNHSNPHEFITVLPDAMKTLVILPFKPDKPISDLDALQTFLKAKEITSVKSLRDESNRRAIERLVAKHKWWKECEKGSFAATIKTMVVVLKKEFPEQAQAQQINDEWLVEWLGSNNITERGLSKAMATQHSVLAKLIRGWWDPKSYSANLTFFAFTKKMCEKLNATYPSWRDRLDEETILSSYLEENGIRRYNTLQSYLNESSCEALKRLVPGRWWHAVTGNTREELITSMAKNLNHNHPTWRNDVDASKILCSFLAEHSIKKPPPFADLTQIQQQNLQALSKTSRWWKQCTSIAQLLEKLNSENLENVNDSIVLKHLLKEFTIPELEKALKTASHELLDSLVCKHWWDGCGASGPGCHKKMFKKLVRRLDERHPGWIESL